MCVYIYYQEISRDIYIIKRSQECVYIYYLIRSIEYPWWWLWWMIPRLMASGASTTIRRIAIGGYIGYLISVSYSPKSPQISTKKLRVRTFYHSQICIGTIYKKLLYFFLFIYIYIHIHRHKPCFSVDFLDGTTPTSAWPPDRCSVPCVSTVAVPRPVPRSLPVRRNGETWWFYAWTMNSTINAVCDSDKKIFQSRLLLNVDTQQHELNKL